MVTNFGTAQILVKERVSRFSVGDLVIPISVRQSRQSAHFVERGLPRLLGRFRGRSGSRSATEAGAEGVGPSIPALVRPCSTSIIRLTNDRGQPIRTTFQANESSLITREATMLGNTIRPDRPAFQAAQQTAFNDDQTRLDPAPLVLDFLGAEPGQNRKISSDPGLFDHRATQLDRWKNYSAFPGLLIQPRSVDLTLDYIRRSVSEGLKKKPAARHRQPAGNGYTSTPTSAGVIFS